MRLSHQEVCRSFDVRKLRLSTEAFSNRMLFSVGIITSSTFTSNSDWYFFVQPVKRVAEPVLCSLVDLDFLRPRLLKTSRNHFFKILNNKKIPVLTSREYQHNQFACQFHESTRLTGTRQSLIFLKQIIDRLTQTIFGQQ